MASGARSRRNSVRRRLSASNPSSAAGPGRKPNGSSSGKGSKNADSQATDVVALLPLRTDVAFPDIILPLVMHREKGIQLVDHVVRTRAAVGLVTQRDADIDDPGIGDLYPAFTIANVLRSLKFPDGSTRVVTQGVCRARMVEVIEREPFLVVRYERIEDEVEKIPELDATLAFAQRLFTRLVKSQADVPEELQVAAMNTPAPGPWADVLASGLPFSIEEKIELLAEANVRHRLRKLATMLQSHVEIQFLSSKIQNEAQSELARVQREQFLRQQASIIKRELGEFEDENSEIREFYERIEEIGMPEAADREARRELERMAQMHSSMPEYHVIRNYLDTLLAMPWKVSTEDRLDLRRAKRILEEDHYGLEKVKRRILEFLAVRKLKGDMRGPILCFVGPPGVGKTSLGKSIAYTMNRKFYRISLGGVHDEAEIRGHRRTYIGSMPGRIVQGLRKLGTNNPVLMLDEVDKMGRDFRGDPSAALLEVLDPEQNSTFRDHYLEVEFDLSKCLFICTANQLATIPHPLLDRMEVIEISGYSEEEKIEIARRHLIPKQLTDHGLSPQSAEFTESGVRTLISGYTQEAGLRNLEREIAAVCRRVAKGVAEGNRRRVLVDETRVQQLLGPKPYLREETKLVTLPGEATGLAWTPAGGETLTIESLRAVGKGELKLTGSLGDVMKESAHAAVSYLRAHATDLGIEAEFFERSDLHIHMPAGAISKDGPSAGIALTASLLSLAIGRSIQSRLAMTGEITLSGRILPVGGIREKILAARREGIHSVILPAANQKDTAELAREVRDDFTFIFVRHMDEVVPHLFSEEPVVLPKRGKAKVVQGKNRSGPPPRPQPKRPRTRPVPHPPTV